MQEMNKADSLDFDLAPAFVGSTSLAEVANWYDTWLDRAALPLWQRAAVDQKLGGFYEALTSEGIPLEAAHRARVQARQIYVYATAGRRGWPGPWRDVAVRGLGFFLSRYRRPDGLFRTLVGRSGEVVDDTAMLYDQAFVLLATASLAATDLATPSLHSVATALRQALEASRHPAGGFRENGDQPFQANAHMHLFEGALAWAEVGGGAPWDTLAGEIADLAMTRFIDVDSGALREFFDDSWAPKPGDDGRLIEPGHQFEWAWLLERWGRRSGDARACAAARRLFGAGVRGFDAERGVVVNALWDNLETRDRCARLWPQTEYLKASLILQPDVGSDHALQAAAGLRKYLNTPLTGAWFDTLEADGTFRQEPAPASSFYHIMAACEALRVSVAEA